MGDAAFREKIESLSLRGDRRGGTNPVKDELGNTVTEHWGDSGRQDVHIDMSDREPIRMKKEQ